MPTDNCKDKKVPAFHEKDFAVHLCPWALADHLEEVGESLAAPTGWDRSSMATVQAQVHQVHAEGPWAITPHHAHPSRGGGTVVISPILKMSETNLRQLESSDQGHMVAAETGWLVEPKIFTIWPFSESIC